MAISLRQMRSGAIWTVGTFGVSVIARFGTNVVLARLLAPEIFGIMVIVNSLRTAVEQITDVGIGQNIIYNRNGDAPNFQSTAWTLQAARGLLLFIVLVAFTVPLSYFFELPILVYILPVAGLACLISGLTSTAVFLLDRSLQFRKRNLFDLTLDVFGSVIHIVFAYLSPTVWALVWGFFTQSFARAASSHFLSGASHRFAFNKAYARQILTFGQWIFVSSLIYFASTNFDRLYLGKVAALSIVGTYGVARSISELSAMLVVRVGALVVFPIVSSASTSPRMTLRQHLAPLRFKSLLALAVPMAIGIALSDIVIKTLYDERYHDAAWMLPILMLGAWTFAVCSINESILLGLGKPSYGTMGNVVKLVGLVVGIPLAFSLQGVHGVVVVIAASELVRYFVLLLGQIREKITFALQDFLATLVLAALISVTEAARWYWGLPSVFHVF